MGETIDKKLVIIGDGACGKTCIVSIFSKNEYPEGYIPTVYEETNKIVPLADGRNVRLKICDTAGQEEYDRLRPVTYTNANVFLLCFAIDSRTSYENIKNKWIKEFEHFCPGVPFILVGNKKDLRDNPKTLDELKKKGEKPLSFDEGQRLAKAVKADCYMECSALRKAGVSPIFDKAVSLSLLERRRRQRLCVLL